MPRKAGVMARRATQRMSLSCMCEEAADLATLLHETNLGSWKFAMVLLDAVMQDREPRDR